MGNNWTNEQLEAINQRGCNLLVAAAAGAGKTAVLVERIIRKITDAQKPVDIDKLLVVTFTNAAATEMRERIGKALADMLDENPSEINLQNQMALLDRANIMTLHSFCLEVVRSHFQSLDLDPSFRIADETESMLMKLDALEELFEEKYESEDTESEFFRLVDSYGGGRGDNSLGDIILSLHRYAQSHPWPGQWLAAQAEALRPDASACLSSTPWAQVLLRGAAAELEGLTALLERAAAAASIATGLEPYCGVLEEDIEQLKKLARVCREALAAQSTHAPHEADSVHADHITNTTHSSHWTYPSDSGTGLPMDAASDSQTDSTVSQTVNSESQLEASSSQAAASAPRTAVSCSETAASVWDTVHQAFSSYSPSRLPRCKKDADEDVQVYVKEIRNLVKEKVKKLCESGFGASEAQIKEDFAILYPLFKYLTQMICQFDELYSEKKKAKGVLDFNDLEHYCLKVLIEDGKPSQAAKLLSRKFEEILVDEYQDTNMIQECILEAVSGKYSGIHNIFMVGDVKQSIYRFRQAKPELFLSKYESYPKEAGHDSRVIKLYKNFRSRPEVINGVNFIFKQIMSDRVGELDYNDEEALNPGAVFEPSCFENNEKYTAGGPIELHIVDVTSARSEIVPGEGEDDSSPLGTTAIERDALETAAILNAGKLSSASPGDINERDANASITNSGGTNANVANHSSDSPGGSKENAVNASITNPSGTNETTADEDQEPIDNIQAEARIIGERIRKLVSEDKGLAIYDKNLDNSGDKKKGGYRKAEYRDIVILMRATSRWADIFADELSSMGIPAYADTGLGYFDAVEVETMLCLLQIIDNPLQDIPMLAVLRSPIGGFGAEELAEIRLCDKSVSIYEAMKLYAMESQKAEDFLNKLNRWRDLSRHTPTDELVWLLLTETGYLTYVGILPGGPERQANLRMLFERARQYEQTSYKGLFNFINFIGRLRSGGGDMGSAKVLGENENVVRIMSIHKSKGLEFPVVFVAGCGKKFNLRDLNERILLHQEMGFGPDVVDLERRTISPSMPKFAIRQKLHLEALSEEMRILYVAFTRAKEKLILTGSVRDIEKACSKWRSVAETKDEKLPDYDIQQAQNYLDWIGPAVARHKSAGLIRHEAQISTGDGVMAFDGDESCWEIKFWGMGAAKADNKCDSAFEGLKNWLEGKTGESVSETDRSGNKACESNEPVSKSTKSTSETDESAGTTAESVSNSSTELIRRLEWNYPYKALTAVPAKISVTELKRRFADAEDEQQEASGLFAYPVVGKPLFMEPDSGLDAARKGTIMHFVMQHVELSRISAALTREDSEGASGALYNELSGQLASMVEKEQLTQPEADVANIKAIEAFFKTQLGRRMLNAESVHRETTFNIEIKATEAFKELPEEIYGSEMLLLQGVIDCWFETGDGIVLIDYKTDYVPAGGSEIIRKRYNTQLDYYTKALERITGRNVSEKYLYLFYSGDLLKC